MTDVLTFKRAAIVRLVEDMKLMKSRWEDDIQPALSRWDFVLDDTPEKAVQGWQEINDRLVTVLHAMVEPFPWRPAEFDQLLMDLGFAINDDVLRQAARRMGEAAYREVALDETTRPVALKQARIMVLQRVLHFEPQTAARLVEHYITAQKAAADERR